MENDSKKSIIENTVANLRSRLQTTTNDFMGTTNKMIDDSTKLTSKSQSILDELENTISNNVQKMKDAGLDQHSPVFMRNHIGERIMDDEKKVDKKSSLVSSTVEEIQEEKPNTSEMEKEQAAGVKKDNANAKLLDKKKVRELGASLKTRVFGQDEVIDEIVDILKVAALNIKINKQKPAGCYLFAGPSGVGKTELAQSISDQLGVPLLKVNMGEYGLEQDVTKLIGTSKGYVGYNEGGLLTNFVTENPACVVLLDELEKAHTSIDKILLSIMDHGSCTDNKGNNVAFKETIVISTSNLGAEVEYDAELDKATKNKIRMQSIKQGLRPEIINRYDSIFHFNALTPAIYKLVTDKFLIKLNENMTQEHQFSLKFTPKLIEFIVDKSYDPAMGGRPARKFIEKVVIKPLADYMLLDEFEQVAKEAKEITMDLNKDNKIIFRAKRKILGVLENTEELVSRVEEGKFTNKPKRLKP